jgi:hypothetical protein
LSAALREPDRLLGLVDVVCQVAHAGEDVRPELTVTTDPHEVERTVEVLSGTVVAADVVRHPAGHLG